MFKSMLAYVQSLNTRRVWNVSFWSFVGAVVLVSGKSPIDDALGHHAGFIPAYIHAVYDGFVTWAGWPTLISSGAGLAVGKPPLPKPPAADAGKGS